MRTILLLALAAFALPGCGSSKTVTVERTTSAGASSASSSSTTSSTRTATSGAKTSAPQPVTILHVNTFRSPSGNIGCTLLAGTARCDIKQRSWSPGPRPADCPTQVDFGQGLNVGASGPGRLVCAGDTALDPAAVPLPYGTETRSGGFSCSSRTSGVTCRALVSGHGFFISAGSYRIF